MKYNKNSNAIKAEQSSLFSYWPVLAIYLLSLFLVFLFTRFQTNPDYMASMMGFVLFFFGVIKLNDVRGFAKGFAKYDPMARRSPLYAHAYPFIEMLLGALFIAQLFLLPATIITLVIYSSSLYGTIVSLIKKEAHHCVCLGTYFKLPLSRVALTESIFMNGMSIWMLVMFNQMAGQMMGMQM